MNAMEEIVWEIFGEDATNSDPKGLPPGFRFHPTDEELVTFYLASKVFNGGLCASVDILEVDLNRCEPWELPEAAKMGEREWYFFSLRDRKYPTGLRTNRATGSGYWKATGKDREVRVAATAALVGMKKTLVFYKGRAPRGEKTKWILHEYRLDGLLNVSRITCKDEWVICRIFHKCPSDKKSPYYPSSNPKPSTHLLDQTTSSSYPNPNPNCFPPLLDLQTLENHNTNPMQSFLNPTETSINGHENPLLTLPSSSTSTFTNLLKLPQCPPDQQQDHQGDETASMSNSYCWLDYSYMQNPFIYEMGLPHFWPPISADYDPYSIVQSAPLIP